MRIPDLARLHGLDALRHLGAVLADVDPIRRHGGGEVTVEAQPVDRAGEPFVVPAGRPLELVSEIRRPQLEGVDLTLDGNQLVAELGLDVDQEHEMSVRTFAPDVK